MRFVSILALAALCATSCSVSEDSKNNRQNCTSSAFRAISRSDVKQNSEAMAMYAGKLPSPIFENCCISGAPLTMNMGNPGGYLSMPVFMKVVEDGGNYYCFVVNHNPGGIVRLDFGNSLTNEPRAVDLGNPGKALNDYWGNESIEIVKANGNWYGIVVGGNPRSSTTPRLVTIKFGPNLDNPRPEGINWGNVGNMWEPVDLHVFNEKGQWYGYTINSESNTLTRFDFTDDFENPPTGVNLGNMGNFDYPTGMFVANDKGEWRMFIVNRDGFSISRLDFGESLLSRPNFVDLGNPDDVLSLPRDLTIVNACGQYVGFVVNELDNTISRLDFSNLSEAPTGMNLGNLGNFDFPHAFSELFHEGDEIYSFITNVSNNTITRVKFTNCFAPIVYAKPQTNLHEE